MKFWDSSGIVPVVVKEKQSKYCLDLLSEDQDMLVWCLSRLEVLSALCRQLREGIIDDAIFGKARDRLDAILHRAYEVTSLDKVRSRAARLLEVHPLRAGDACQLGAALVATHDDPARLPLVCFDRRLMAAARREGFVVNPMTGD